MGNAKFFIAIFLFLLISIIFLLNSSIASTSKISDAAAQSSHRCWKVSSESGSERRKRGGFKISSGVTEETDEGFASVVYTMVSGTATAGQDFIVESGTLSIDLNSAVGSFDQIWFTVIDDSEYEGQETFYVVLSSPQGIPLCGGVSSYRGTIVDNDRPPTPTPTPTPMPPPTPTPDPGNAGGNTPPPPELPDIWISGIEINQAIQNLDNSAPLIADKQTYIRVYIQSDMPVSGPTYATLYDKRSGATYVSNNKITASTNTLAPYHRFNDNQSLNFLYPKSWAAGTVDFEFEIVTDDVQEKNYSNNVETISVGFHDMPPISMRWVRINYKQGNTILKSSWQEFIRARQFMLDAYPISETKIYHGRTIDFDGDLTKRAGWVELLQILEKLDIMTYEPDESVIWFGLVPGKAKTSDIDGIANGLGIPPAASKPVAPYMAHEVAHVLGIKHVLCSGEEDEPDTRYPYPEGRIGDGSASGYWGVRFNQSKPEMIYPLQARDLMTYCSQTWISDYTYANLWAQIRNRYRSSLSPFMELNGQQSYLMVSGIYDPIAQSGTLEPAFKLADHNNTYVSAEGPFIIELKDKDNELLVSHEFTIDDINDIVGFVEIVPFHEEATQLVFKHEEELLASIIASPNSPTLSAPTIYSDTPSNENIEISWTAFDTDGDELRYVIQYSTDGGTTWEALAVDWTETSYTIDTTSLSESNNALIRIIASDGFNTSYAVTDTALTVSEKSPEAIIFYPSDGQHIEPSTIIIFDGQGVDPEDGPLLNNSLSWESSRDGFLGQGHQLVTTNLSPGHHTITLSVNDSNENVGTTSIDVFIDYRLFLPALYQQE